MVCILAGGHNYLNWLLIYAAGCFSHSLVISHLYFGVFFLFPQLLKSIAILEWIFATSIPLSLHAVSSSGRRKLRTFHDKMIKAIYIAFCHIIHVWI